MKRYDGSWKSCRNCTKGLFRKQATANPLSLQERTGEEISRAAWLERSATTAKPPPVFARPDRLDRGIQGQQVRLAGDFRDLADLLGAGANLLHPYSQRWSRPPSMSGNARWTWWRICWG